MPVGLPLPGVRGREQPLLREMRSDDLQADRQSVDQTAGHRHRRQAGQIRADGIDVVQVHRDRIVGLRADRECGRRRRRSHQHVDFAECALEVGIDEAPHLLRLQVVGVVIAGRQHVGAGHDTAFDLGAETFAARALVEIHQIARFLAAVAEAHAIVARQVRRAFRRRDHIVRSAPTAAGSAG